MTVNGQNRKFYLERAMSVLAAILLIQSLFFKFTGAQESMYIFSQLGLEPYGRIGTGIAELIIAVLLIVPKTSLIGAVLGIGVIGGAILSHLFILGIEVQGDGGLLFGLALIIFISCAISILLQRKKLNAWFKTKGIIKH